MAFSNLKFYLSVSDRKYELNFPITDELDIYGWDIRKVLQLLKKSNTTPFEWLQSPIIYGQDEAFKNELWALCQHYFSARANIHHYLGIAKGFMEMISQGGETGIKKLFYVLRPLLSAKWCLEKNTIAPMTIGPLMKLLPAEFQMEVQELIQLKSGLAESAVITVNAGLLSYINSEFTRISEASGNLPRDNFELNLLDDFFCSDHYQI